MPRRPSRRNSSSITSACAHADDEARPRNAEVAPIAGDLSVRVRVGLPSGPAYEGGAMAVTTAKSDILAEENRQKRDDIIRMLTKAYWMEIETVVNYIANST